MLKKNLLLTLFASALILGACGSESAESETTADTEETDTAADTAEDTATESEETEETNVNLPSEDIGEGDFFIVNQSGSSEDSDVVEFYDSDLLTPSLGIEAWEMDGSYKTFIYFDGELVAEEQLADAQTSIDIPIDKYEVGSHTVTAVQYEGNTEDGEPIFVRNIDFEIQE